MSNKLITQTNLALDELEESDIVIDLQNASGKYHESLGPNGQF